MKVAIIGTINLDTILSPQGDRKSNPNEFGGILYSAVTIATLSKEFDVHPVSWIGKDHHSAVIDLLSSFHNIHNEGIQNNPNGTNENLIRYKADQDREETLVSRVPPIFFEMISPHLDADLILVNLISGFDLSLDTLQMTKRNNKGIVYLDLHSLTLGIEANGRRFPQKIDHWEEWVGSCDILQANSHEVSRLLSMKFDSRESYDTAGFRLLESGPRVVMITFGGEGSTLYYRTERVKTSISIPGKKKRIKDTTGCGDVFGGSFVVSYLQKKDPVEALHFANQIAAKSTRFIGIKDLRKLRNR